MNISFKAAAVLAVTVMFLAAPVFAPSVYGQSSPTGTATAGVFTTDVEDSMDVHSWTGVEFDKWTGFAGYGSTSNPISLGYATRFGDGLYLGAWYTGNIANKNSTEEQSIVSQYSLTNQLLTEKTTTITYTDQYTSSNNRLNVLLGVAGMGFKIGFYESLTVYEYPDITKTVVEDANGASKTYTNDYIVDDYLREEGWLTPSLEWGMSLEAGDLTIKPKVGVSFGIRRNTNIYNVKANYSTLNGEVVGAETVNYNNGTISDYLQPSFTVGADVDLSPEVTLGLSYGMGFTAYNNSYDNLGFSGTAAGEVSLTGSTTVTQTLATTTTTTTGTLRIIEKTAQSHTITPSFYYSKEIADGLELGFLATLPITISARSENPTSNPVYETKTTTKTEYNNPAQRPLNNTREESTVRNNSILEETTQFSIGLSAAAGASYALVPGRFKVNAGISLTPFLYTGTTTKSTRESENQTNTVKTYDADGNLVSTVVSLQTTGGTAATTDTTTDRVSATNTWSAFAVSAAGGFTFNFNENAAIDMAINGGSSNNAFTLNLSSVRVLFSFKF
jgi:hypothetical protein